MSKLTFYGLVAGLGKLKDAQEHLKVQLMKLARTYPGLSTDERFTQIEAHVTASLASFDQMLSEYSQKNVAAESEAVSTIHALLKQLPERYPPATFSKEADGYRLEIDCTIIFHGASIDDAVRHTENYVQARKNSPTLPIGVIYGIYD